MRMLATAAMAVIALVPNAEAAGTLDGKPAVVIGHRGAPGYLPDHTLEGYRMAIGMGVDFIEPDLVVTRDGVLVARHEPMLGGTTDIAQRPEFAARKTTRNVDGVPTTDWFASDLTLAEIKTLRAIQPLAERDQSKNGQFLIPTLDEVIALAKAESARLGRTIGIAPETKHPTWHAAVGLPIEDRLIATLEKTGWTEQASPVVIQSFETANLRYLRSRTKVRLVQLIDGDGVGMDGVVTLAPPYDRPYDFVITGDARTNSDLVTPAGLAWIKTYADGISPWKPYLLKATQTDANGDGKPDDLNGDGVIDERDRTVVGPTSVVADAHAAGLWVHSWTFRSEPKRLAGSFKGDPLAEYRAFYAMGVDGVFSDFPDAAVKARD